MFVGVVVSEIVDVLYATDEIFSMQFCLYSHRSEIVNVVVVSHLAVPFIIVVGWLTGCREAHSC